MSSHGPHASSNVSSPRIPTRVTEELRAGGPIGWLLRGGRLDSHAAHGGEKTYPWYSVLCLTGVDYFSTLGYQPGIALLAAGVLSPVATLFLVAVTLLCALPVYAQVAGRSYAWQGSIALLENLLPGWLGKAFVLVLLGFAGTDFVITITLSAADAAEHAVHNPILHPWIGDHNITLTLVMLGLLAAVFLKGFTEAIGLAVAVTVPFLAINLLVLARGLWEVAGRPELLANWQSALISRGSVTDVLMAGALVFPSLALGLSGFETGVSVMPLVRGDEASAAGQAPAGRIRNTRKLLVGAALIMSVMLALSSFVTTLLIPPREYAAGGPANGRAIAHLTHKLFGPGIGTAYDIITILILWFAGASAMAGLLHLIPRYLPRFGMAPRWVAYSRPLVLAIFFITVVVTLAFRADVNAQGGAYATGVLVLMLSAAIAAAIALRRESRRVFALYGWLVAAVFAYTLAENVSIRPDGLIIASIFCFVIMSLSGISRLVRSVELRIAELHFADEESEHLWRQLAGKKVNLVPVRSMNAETRRRKEEEIRRHYKVDGPVAFLNVELLDNRSEFLAHPKVRVREEKGNFHIKVTGASAIANTVAYVSEVIDPIRLFLGLSRKNLVGQAARFVLLGEGETGLMVYTILLNYWEWTPEEDVRPLIFLMSD